MKQHHVFIATSLDGYIADAEGGVGFLIGLFGLLSAASFAKAIPEWIAAVKTKYLGGP